MNQVSRRDGLLGHLGDVAVMDEAYRMAAHNFDGELKTTRRYQLGELLGRVTRHFLLMTAAPHAGKEEEDFQAFLALLDEGQVRGPLPQGRAPRRHGRPPGAPTPPWPGCC